MIYFKRKLHYYFYMKNKYHLPLIEIHTKKINPVKMWWILGRYCFLPRFVSLKSVLSVFKREINKHWKTDKDPSQTNLLYVTLPMGRRLKEYVSHHRIRCFLVPYMMPHKITSVPVTFGISGIKRGSANFLSILGSKSHIISVVNI